MEPKEIEKILKSSFTPLRCEVEISEFVKILQFRVFNENNETVITSPKIPIYEGFNKSSLIPYIKTAKNKIKNKDYSID